MPQTQKLPSTVYVWILTLETVVAFLASPKQLSFLSLWLQPQHLGLAAGDAGRLLFEQRQSL